MHRSASPLLNGADLVTSNSADLEARPDLSRKPALGAAQDDVKEFLARRHRLDLFPCCLHDCNLPKVPQKAAAVRCGHDLRSSPIESRKFVRLILKFRDMRRKPKEARGKLFAQ